LAEARGFSPAVIAASQNRALTDVGSHRKSDGKFQPSQNLEGQYFRRCADCRLPEAVFADSRGGQDDKKAAQPDVKEDRQPVQTYDQEVDQEVDQEDNAEAASASASASATTTEAASAEAAVEEELKLTGDWPQHIGFRGRVTTSAVRGRPSVFRD
jgi:hypothetical protein